MKSLELNFRSILISISLIAFSICINTGNIIAKSSNIAEDDTLKTKLEVKVVELKKVVKELNNLIETESPEDISPEAVDNWYKQSAWLLGSRNVIEEYYIDLNRFLDYLEHESSRPTEEEIHQRVLEFKSGLYDYINEGKEFIGLTIAASERQEKALEILNSQI
ncbi:MAG: hypothetical protein ISS16_12345 [Ignavibacteria bacterium]|nr:hypothetical protein [Ignavibacteria bacterium]